MKLTSDNKIIYALGIMGRLVIVNVLVILCSLPVVTAEAALAAGYACMTGKEAPDSEVTACVFFRVFRSSLRVGIPVGLLLLAGTAAALGDLFYAVAVAERVNWFFLCFAVLMLITLAGIGVWTIPLLARYENTVSGYLKNAFLLAFGRLPVTLAVWAVILTAMLPLGLAGFVRSFGWLYPLCGAAGILYLAGLILERDLSRKEKLWQQFH